MDDFPLRHSIDNGRVVSISLPLVLAYRADGWTALGDPTRRAIFERLADHPRAVGELASELPVSRPAVSQHLKVLKDAGLVIDRPVGTRRVYQLNPDGVGVLRAQLDRFWNQALAAYKQVVEQPTEEVS
jgi:DNA-binding transcriptional ArsR family regulator